MTMLAQIRALWEHAFWADARLLDALRATGGAPPEALGEYAHIIGAEEVWLARLQRRPPQAAVWPAASFAEVERLAAQTHAAYKAYLSGLQNADLESAVAYTNSAGQAFTNSVGDILLHAALHGQYHRGKVNLLLRQAGHAPAPADYIAFVRGVPAAVRR